MALPTPSPGPGGRSGPAEARRRPADSGAKQSRVSSLMLGRVDALDSQVQGRRSATIDEVSTMTQTRPFETAESLYDHLLDLHAQVFAGERFETAYHLLAAAMHVAEELDDVDRLSSIERLAGDRQAEVDRSQPQQKTSSESAAGRGMVARFTTLSLTARAARGRINADRATKRTR